MEFGNLIYDIRLMKNVFIFIGYWLSVNDTAVGRQKQQETNQTTVRYIKVDDVYSLKCMKNIAVQWENANTLKVIRILISWSNKNEI